LGGGSAPHNLFIEEEKNCAQAYREKVFLCSSRVVRISGVVFVYNF